jgi:hypothetical protein
MTICYICKKEGLVRTTVDTSDSDNDSDDGMLETIFQDISINGIQIESKSQDVGICQPCFHNLNCLPTQGFLDDMQVCVAIFKRDKYPYLFLKGSSSGVESQLKLLQDPSELITIFDNVYLNQIVVQYFQPITKNSKMLILVQNEENLNINYVLSSEKAFWREYYFQDDVWINQHEESSKLMIDQVKNKDPLPKDVSHRISISRYKEFIQKQAIKNKGRFICHGTKFEEAYMEYHIDAIRKQIENIQKVVNCSETQILNFSIDDILKRRKVVKDLGNTNKFTTCVTFKH